MERGVRIGLIGGSGLGQVLADVEPIRRHEIDTPFGRPSDAITEVEWHGLPVFLLSRHGPGHVLPPSAVPYRANLFAMKRLGITHVLASGAAGSLREQFKPRDVVVPDQLLDRTHHRSDTFYERAAVHVEFAEPFCPRLRDMLLAAAEAMQPANAPPSDPAVAGLKSITASAAPDAAPFAVHDRGCYVCMEGPAFSTRAESLANRLLGGDLIGMTALPEAKLAREAEIAYALVGLVTDFDAWRPKLAPAADAAPASQETLLAEIIGNLNAAVTNGMALLRKTVELIAADPLRVAGSPAHEALKHAIWSDKQAIDRGEVERLRPLWGRHFE